MAKSLSRNDIRDRARKFAVEWHDEKSERSEAQTFWNEFLAVFGVQRRQVALFEEKARRLSTGGTGRIDLLWPGLLIAEHKSEGKNLEEAEEQALDYLYDSSFDRRQLPRFVITSDFARIRIKEIGSESAVTIETIDLPQEIDRFLFLAGYEPRSHAIETSANVDAARLMGRLYEEVADVGYDNHSASVLMTRLLFLLFGDDTGMWPRDLFASFIDDRTTADGSDLGPQLALLFQVLDTPLSRRAPNLDEALAQFPYVNGGLFRERLEIPSFNRRMREELLACSLFDWGKISPAVFGSLFQSIKSKEARREMGEHYTTEENIFRVIDPLFLTELRSEYLQSHTDIGKLKRLRENLGKMKFIDPAMGCGNFLIVTYRELRRLELQIMTRLRELTGENQLSLDPTLGLRVAMDNFGGIEIEEWPARIAETAMFLVDHQCNLELVAAFGEAPDRLPIDTSAKFVRGNALDLPWEEVMPATDTTFVLGNPPFLGSKMTSAEQKKDQRRVWDGAVGSGTLDYVSNWFLLAGRYMGSTKARAAFVATNSITQGEQPSRIWGAKGLREFGTKILFACQTFKWSSEAPGQAAVHCVIVGITNHSLPDSLSLWVSSEDKLTLSHRIVRTINPYLVEGPWVLIGSRSKPISDRTPIMRFGSQPNDKGFLSNIDEAERQRIGIADPVADSFMRRLVGSQEMLHSMKRYCLWLKDATPNEIARSSELQSRIRGTKIHRETSKDAGTREGARWPSLFFRDRQPVSRFLAVPGVSSENREYVSLAFFDASVIASNAIFTISDANYYHFGVLSSSVFNAWLAAVSGRLKSDFRISAEITYNNFPWPIIDDRMRQKIETAAETVLDERLTFPDATLATLYSPLSMPVGLREAHRALDRLVLRAYDLPGGSSNERILSELFNRYATTESQSDAGLL